MTAPSNADSVLDTYERHINAGSARIARLMGGAIEQRSSGAYVYDANGDRYLDCGGYGVFLLGHCHPAVTSAVTEQLHRHPIGTRALLSAELARASSRLASVAPDGLDFVYFTTSGTEAVETALKLARMNGYPRAIAMRDAFHGKTTGSLSLTERSLYRDPFEPLHETTFVAFGDATALEAELSASNRPACVFVEPIQAEGGVNIPPPGYLAQVRRLCDRHGALLVADEIQTGLGRTGSWWALDADQVAPDLLLAGKALGGGVVPIGAVVTTAELFAGLNRDPLLHTSTFSGYPLGAVAAEATIGTIQSEGLVERSAKIGSQLLSRLRDLAVESGADLAAEVRGRGLMIGIEFNEPGQAGAFALELFGHNVIVSHSLNTNRVVRLLPPAIIGEAEVELLCTTVADSLAAVSARADLGAGVGV